MSSIDNMPDMSGISGALSTLGSMPDVLSRAATSTIPGTILNNEVNPSPYRPATDGAHSVNSADT